VMLATVWEARLGLCKNVPPAAELGCRFGSSSWAPV